jgi:hypothetical protein
VAEVVSFFSDNRIDLVAGLALVMYAVHKKFLVLGREYEREVERGDKLEIALDAATIRELHADEANAKMAGLVPDLLKLSLSAKESDNA